MTLKWSAFAPVPGERALPSPTEEFGRFVTTAEVDWSDFRSVIEYQVGYSRMLAGGRPPLGYTLSGSLAAAFGPAFALVAGAAACAALVVGVGVTRKELRDPYLGSIPILTLADGDEPTG